MFKRTLKQFLDCEDLESEKGVALIEKLRDSSRDSLHRLIEVIPETNGMHNAVLQEICLENIAGDAEELFLESLDDTKTNIRSTAASTSTRCTFSSTRTPLHRRTPTSRRARTPFVKWQRCVSQP